MTRFAHICHGLRKMHDMGVSHRQLDSKNILFKNEPHVGLVLKLAGFSEACRIETINKQNILSLSYEEKYEEIDSIGKNTFKIRN